MLVTGATAQLSYYTQTEKHQAFREASSDYMHCASVFRLDDKKSSFATKSCSCALQYD